MSHRSLHGERTRLEEQMTCRVYTYTYVHV
jgi:hypothetical protein